MNDDNQKIAKKQAKAQVKEVKKQQQAGTVEEFEPDSSTGPSPAERSASAAERQVKLQRWRAVFAVISTLIALATLGMVFFKQ